MEFILKFNNKGKTRIRLYNIQVGINTMGPQNEARIDATNGRLKLTRIYTSGNIVPIFKVENKPVNKTSFYYIEPGNEQIITHVCLIAEPRELIQVFALFNFEQSRLFPEIKKGRKRLYPQSATKIYSLNKQEK